MDGSRPPDHPAADDFRDGRARLGVAVLGPMWLILPGLVYLLGLVWPPTAIVLHRKPRATADARREQDAFQPSNTVAVNLAGRRRRAGHRGRS